MIKVGILTFPGTNCERDLIYVLEKEYNCKCYILPSTTSFKDEYSIYFLPGGFSFGDYLRSGSLASVSLAMSSLKEAHRHNKKIIGICNGFQILTESHLLPGALIYNHTLLHICKWVKLTVPSTSDFDIPPDYALPISHSEGNYFCDTSTLKELEDQNQIFLQYKDNVNGSINKIAGITNKEKNIIGLMPHPERAILNSQENIYSTLSYGKYFFNFIFNQV